ncbi:hypothetical protein F5051DRAFT_434206 [Lentinula edodes]|nr:hypothetical protein F5051DRAFT_434206 [Lentinula edodes]
MVRSNPLSRYGVLLSRFNSKRRHEAVREKFITVQEHLEENTRKPVYVDSPISSNPNSSFSSHRPSCADTTEFVGNPNNSFSPLVSRSTTVHVHGNGSVINIFGNGLINYYINSSIPENFGNIFNGNEMFGSGMRRQQETGAERRNTGNGGFNETYGYLGSYNELTHARSTLELKGSYGNRDRGWE